MQYTTNYNIPKFDGTDALNPNSRNGLNNGADIVDTQLKANADVGTANTSAIGTLANLETTEKSNLVGAINEQEDKIDILYNGDYIIAEGKSGSWTYRKWNSGIMEMWANLSAYVDITRAWGSMYVGDIPNSIAYPFTFSSSPTLTVSIIKSLTCFIVECESNIYGITALQFGRATSSSGNAQFGVVVKGRWKE